MLNNIKNLWEKSTPYHNPIFFIGGFIFDVFTLGQIDESWNLLQQSFFFAILVLFIVWEVKEIKINIPFFQKFIQFEQEVFHFILGALLSVFTLFFFKSSSLSNSLIFMLLFSLLLVVNEMKIFKNQGLLIRWLSVCFCLFCFMLILVQLVLGKLGLISFLISLIIYMALVWIFFRYTISKKSNLSNNQFLGGAAGLGLVFLTFYLLKIIPPVPLSLKHIGAYRLLEKKEQSYLATFKKPIWKFWLKSETDFSYNEGDRVYIFAKIFSPVGFSDRVYFQWEKYQSHTWVKTDKIPVGIRGGRAEGFRAFTYKSNLSYGSWRVKILSHEGLEIGRHSFELTSEVNNYPLEILKF